MPRRWHQSLRLVIGKIRQFRVNKRTTNSSICFPVLLRKMFKWLLSHGFRQNLYVFQVSEATLAGMSACLLSHPCPEHMWYHLRLGDLCRFIVCGSPHQTHGHPEIEHKSSTCVSVNLIGTHDKEDLLVSKTIAVYSNVWAYMTESCCFAWHNSVVVIHLMKVTPFIFNLDLRILFFQRDCQVY